MMCVDDDIAFCRGAFYKISGSLNRSGGGLAGCPGSAQAGCGRTDMTSTMLVMYTVATLLQQQQLMQGASQPASPVAAHGNYRNYYGYRGSAEEDPRLQVTLSDMLSDMQRD